MLVITPTLNHRDPEMATALPLRPMPGVGRRMRALLRDWGHARGLLAWNARQPRPSALAHVPDRLWRRHSALLSLSGGAAPGLLRCIPPG